MSKFIPYSHQYIDQEDINAVIEVLKSDFITQGPKIEEFEKLLADYCGAKYAVVFSSGTAALHSAYFVSGIKECDEIITSPVTFLATANAGLFLGTKPIFVDIEPDTGNINSDLIAQVVTEKTKVIVPIHYGGHPVDLERISNIAKKYNLLVIEDASHALGAEYKIQKPEVSEINDSLRTIHDSRQSPEWIKIGSCEYSDMAIFSFHPVKPITTGEGGAVLTNNRDYYEKLVMFRQHGVTKNSNKFVNKDLAFTLNSNPWYYEMQILGYNYRLTDIQCALGTSQMKKLDRFIQKRRKIVEIYKEAFKDNDFFELPKERKYAKSSWHLYPIRLKGKYKEKKGEIFEKLREKGLGVQVHYIPVYWQPHYQNLGYQKELCPIAEDFYQREISIPLYQSMDTEEINYVIDCIFKTLKKI